MSTRRGFLFGLAALPFAPVVVSASPLENLVLKTTSIVVTDPTVSTHLTGHSSWRRVERTCSNERVSFLYDNDIASMYLYSAPDLFATSKETP